MSEPNFVLFQLLMVIDAEPVVTITNLSLPSGVGIGFVFVIREKVELSDPWTYLLPASLRRSLLSSYFLY
jgi:hypothetical protein